MTSDFDGTYIISGRTYRLGFLRPNRHDRDQFTNPKFRLRIQRQQVLALDADLYHYTSLAGFQGIVSSEGFWASDNRFMNDAEETRHGVRLAARALAHRTKRARTPGIAGVLGAVREALLADAKQGNLVACFSTARDSLEQWRAYGQSGGVCIRLGKPKEGERSFVFAPHQMPIQASYGWRAKMMHLLSVIAEFEDEYALDRAAMSDWPDDHDELYVREITSSVSSAITAFKDAAFSREEEVRLVSHYSWADKYGGVKFRASPIGLIPYICTGDHKGIKGRLPISEVIVGPSAHESLIRESIETFLDHAGYQGVPVTPSKVPFRSY